MIHLTKMSDFVRDMYNDPNLGLLEESGMWDRVDIWNLLALMADWQFTYLQTEQHIFPSWMPSTDAAVDM